VTFIELWIDGNTMHSRHDLPEGTDPPDAVMLGEEVYIRKAQTCEYRKGTLVYLERLVKPSPEETPPKPKPKKGKKK
jgi:hypothetical protein